MGFPNEEALEAQTQAGMAGSSEVSGLRGVLNGRYIRQGSCVRSVGYDAVTWNLMTQRNICAQKLKFRYLQQTTP